MFHPFPARDSDLDAINALALARIYMLEDMLQRAGFRVEAGAELEHFLLKQPNRAFTGAIQQEDVRAAFNAEQYYQEEFNGKYEIVFGTLNRQKEGSYAVPEILRNLQDAREYLPEVLKKQNVPLVSFAASAPQIAPAATAGLHTNLSIRREDGDNVFYDCESNSYSRFALSSARTLVLLQRDALPIYLAGSGAVDRLGKHAGAPKDFTVSLFKDGSSVRLRNTLCRDENDGTIIVPAGFRMENVLAPANIPDIASSLVLDLGAAYLTAINHPLSAYDRIKNSDFMIKTLATDKKTMTARFTSSELLREVAGPELHDALIAYHTTEKAKNFHSR